MSDILLIGSTGTLGRAIQKEINCICSTTRFDDKTGWQKLFSQNNFNTVIHVARSCRKNSPRRDYLTMREELLGLINILDAGGKNCNFLYASTKVVYNILNQELWMHPNDIVPYFVDCANTKGQKVIDVPAQNREEKVRDNLSLEHEIYRSTKLASEDLIKFACNNYSILRIWDIQKPSKEN